VHADRDAFCPHSHQVLCGDALAAIVVLPPEELVHLGPHVLYRHFILL
jgi:hypothetical protein